MAERTFFGAGAQGGRRRALGDLVERLYEVERRAPWLEYLRPPGPDDAPELRRAWELLKPLGFVADLERSFALGIIPAFFRSLWRHLGEVGLRSVEELEGFGQAVEAIEAHAANVLGKRGASRRPPRRPATAPPREGPPNVGMGRTDWCEQGDATQVKSVTPPVFLSYPPQRYDGVLAAAFGAQNVLCAYLEQQTEDGPSEVMLAPVAFPRNRGGWDIGEKTIVPGERQVTGLAAAAAPWGFWLWVALEGEGAELWRVDPEGGLLGAPSAVDARGTEAPAFTEDGAILFRDRRGLCLGIARAQPAHEATLDVMALPLDGRPLALAAGGGAWHGVIESEGRWRAFSIDATGRTIGPGPTFAPGETTTRPSLVASPEGRTSLVWAARGGEGYQLFAAEGEGYRHFAAEGGAEARPFATGAWPEGEELVGPRAFLTEQGLRVFWLCFGTTRYSEQGYCLKSCLLRAGVAGPTLSLFVNHALRPRYWSLGHVAGEYVETFAYPERPPRRPRPVRARRAPALLFRNEQGGRVVVERMSLRFYQPSQVDGPPGGSALKVGIDDIPLLAIRGVLRGSSAGDAWDVELVLDGRKGRVSLGTFRGEAAAQLYAALVEQNPRHQPPVETSIEELYATPAAFDRKRVRLRACWARGFEVSALLAPEPESPHGRGHPAGSIWVEECPVPVPGLSAWPDDRPVPVPGLPARPERMGGPHLIEGVFESCEDEAYGHMGASFGQLLLFGVVTR